jgi:hypothetical protein
MKVQVGQGQLPSRDAELKDLPRGFWRERDLSVYLRSAKLKTRHQEGRYRSVQGAKITPVPCWAIEIETTRHHVSGGLQTLPLQEDGFYYGATARWATQVVGTGKEKQKWRGLRLRGKLSSTHCFGVVSSAWLVPFALAHRYIVHIPAEVSITKGEDPINVRHDMAKVGRTSLDAFDGSAEDPEEKAIRNWTLTAQKAWTERSRGRSTKLVTEWLDYMGKVSMQDSRSFRVVHTRSRSFYAAVLDPKGRTALGLPFEKATAFVSQDGGELSKVEIPMAGVICDNLLHYIQVRGRQEAYWMSGVFNTRNFERRVMKLARGEPPGIYTIPQKVLADLGLVFDSSNKEHLRVAQLSSVLERKMGEAIRRYLGTEKGVPLAQIDDTDRGPDIPSTISSALMTRLDAKAELTELNDAVESLIREAGG